MRNAMKTMAVGMAAIVLGACGTMGLPGGPSDSDVPAAIAVPSGATLVVTLKGSGLQNYECRAKADAPGGYDWVLVSPEAALRDRSDAIVGRHYAGPTWEHGDGSKVAGKVLASAPAPTAGNIPWLLLQGTPAATPGTFASVKYIQRVGTSGGVAPSETCNAASSGRRSQVRYSADYRFYRG